ncbi:MAG TPA: aldolase/citrate lyase family protein [Dongiaceae bacterium]|nr:aldolase/citrate lyase family protein [Dongiaceae bacterium]
MKRRLQAGETVVGTWMNLAEPLVAGLLASHGWDWLLIDMEHGPIPLAEAGAMVTAVRAQGGVPIVRVAWNESSQIQRVLDLGAWGIMVPVVNTVDDARRVVRDARFPPLGERSRGGVRANLTFETDPGTYSLRANDEILVLVQVETEQSVANVAEILAVDGIDGVFVGPNDLAFSGGKPWPDVWEKDAAYMKLIDAVPRAAEAAGKFAGILAREAQQALQMAARGYRFVGVGGDVTFLTNGSKQWLQMMRAPRQPG